MKKRIIALLTAVVLLVSSCFAAIVVQAGDNVVDSTLTLSASSTAKKLVFSGTDSIDINSNTKQFKAENNNEGIFVNSSKNADLAFVKRSGNWNINFSQNVADGTVVTVKGTFVYSTYSVRFNTISIKYTNGAWGVIDTPAEDTIEYGRALSLSYANDDVKYGNENGIFLSSNDTLEADTTWSTFISFDDGDNNGVFLNGVKTNTQMKKTRDYNWYVCLSDAQVTIKKDDVITIKGSITHNGKTAVFNEFSFVFDGNTWAVYVETENAEFEQFYIDDIYKYGTNTGIYLRGNDSLEHDASWNTYILFESDENSGVFLNGTKTSVKMKKFSATDWYVCLGDADISAKTGDIVTIKGLISHKSKRVLFEEISLVFNGTTWGLTDDPNLETGRTLTLDVSADNTTGGFFLIGNDSLEALGWEKKIYNDGSADSGVFLNGVKTDTFLKKIKDRVWYVCLSDANITPVTNDKITIKGTFFYGKYKFSFNQVDIIYDGSKWVEEVDTQVVSLDTVDLLTISKYNTDSKKWEIYLSTSKPIPGAEEVTTFDVAMKIDGKNKTIRCKKSSQEQSLAFEIPSSVIPQNPSAEVALTILAGKYNVIGENVKVNLESNTVLYFLNGAVSFTSANFKVDEDNLNFTIDRSQMGGGNKDGLYLNSNDNVPFDTNWATNTVAYEGKNNGVFLNEVKTNAFLKKYDSNKYYVCLSDVNVVPSEGDIIVIKGAFKTNNYISSYNIFTATFIDGSWVDDTTPETKYTTVNITDVDTTVTEFDNEASRWELYFKTKEMLPGNGDQAFNSVNIKIGDDVYAMPCYHSAHKDYFFIIIDSGKLPKDATAKVEVYGKAKSDDQLIGMDVKKFAFYINKYGVSLDGYVKPIEVKEKNVPLTLDTVTLGWTGGTDSGIYFLTKDHFPVDKNWSTPIRAIGYEDNSGVFYNDVKIGATFKKYSDGKVYLDILTAGIVAKDRDKITVKGTFALNGYGVSYKEITLYYNGQSWNQTYKAPIPKQTVKLTPSGIKPSSSYVKSRNAWEIFLKIEEKIPGDNNYEYRTINYEINGKTYEASCYRVEDSLVFYVPDTILPKNTKDGTAIKIKAGKASDRFALYDIDIIKDSNAYTFHLGVSSNKPASKTNYLDISSSGLLRPYAFNEDIKTWQLFFKVDQKFDVDDGAKYFDLPVKLNGKTYDDIGVYRSGDFLYISIPESVLPKDTKTATLTIDKGATAITNSGWNGIKFKNALTIYLFNGVWNEVNFTKQQSTDLKIEHLSSTNFNSEIKRWDIYLNVDKEVPGKNWFEVFEGITVYLNGEKFTSYVNKAESANNKMLYLSLEESVFGEFKNGDVMHIPSGASGVCGGYSINFKRDFYLQFVNGTWFEYYESNVKAPKADETIWDKARIEGYIPVQEEKGIIFTNVEPTNVIKSIENVKDITFTFDTSKMMFNNEELPTNSFVLRGQPLTEGMDVSETALYGYNISFSYIELTKERVPNNPELWGVHSQEIAVWKNGINYSLIDQYRMTYNWKKTNHPFFEHDKQYKYTISIFNVKEDICVIEVYCNDELAMRVVDYGTDDPMDPVYNAGEFRIYASCPQQLYSPEVELDSLIASKNECYVGEQVRVSATYPAILEGSEYTVDGDGATIKNGVFIAKKEGTYTVTGSFNGKPKGTVKIKVTEKMLNGNAAEAESNFPWLPVILIGSGALVVIAAAAVVLIVLLNKKKKKSIV